MAASGDDVVYGAFVNVELAGYFAGFAIGKRASLESLS